MMRNLRKLAAFIHRDFLSEVSYRVTFLFQVGGMFMSVAAFYFMAKRREYAHEAISARPVEVVL
jgi:hypothetical protein